MIAALVAVLTAAHPLPASDPARVPPVYAEMPPRWIERQRGRKKPTRRR